jgi:hypothetical protein
MRAKPAITTAILRMVAQADLLFANTRFTPPITKNIGHR